MARMLLAIAAALLMTNIACGDPAATVELETDKAVLAAVVSLQCQGKSRGNVLLSSKPSAPRETELDHLHGIPDDLIANLVRRTEAGNSLPRGIGCPRVRMVSYVRLQAAFARPAKHHIEFPVPPGVLIPIGANTGFKDTFPDVSVLLRLSMPAYSKSKDTAIAYFTEDCGGLCAHGEYVVLQPVKGEWRVVRRMEAWTS